MLKIDAILELTDIFRKLAQLDQYDWLRTAIDKLRPHIEDPAILAGIDRILSNKIEYSWQKGIGATGVQLKNELNNIRKYFMQQKFYDLAQEVKRQIDLLDLSDTRQGRNKMLANQPRREFAAPVNGLFYHGVPAEDAYGVLKNKIFLKGSAFNMLSLTSDITSAIKFGNVILAFDAAKMQRHGAKKMHYMPEKKYLSRVEKEPSEEYDSPFISEMYRYEQEWVIPLPFKFSDELVKVYIIDSDNTEQIKKMIEPLVNVPIEVMTVPSHASSSPPYSSEDDTQSAPVRAAMFSDVIGPGEEFAKLARQILLKELEKCKQEYGENAEELFKHDRNNITANSIIGSLRALRGHSGWSSVLSVKTIISTIDYIGECVDKLKYTKLEPTIPILKRIYDSKDNLIETFKTTYLKNDDDYINMIRRYNSSYELPLKPYLIMWLNNNPDKIDKIMDYEYFKINDTPLTYLLQEVDPTRIPDHIWKLFHDSLLSNPGMGKISTDRIRTIFNGVELDKWIIESLHEWRLERAEGNAKRNIEELGKMYPIQEEQAS